MRLRFVPIFAAFALMAGAAEVFAGGSLTPPDNAFTGGVPVATMKSMNEVEPRTVISSLPFSITTSGSYYLTRNLVGEEGTNGITISANHVQLDLNGFALVGSTNMSLTNLTHHGIFIVTSPILRNITVRNGVIHNWGKNGIKSGLAKDSKVLGVTVSKNGGANTFDGMNLGDDWIISDCLAAGNTGNGICAMSRCTVRRTRARGNTGSGICLLTESLVVDCMALWNQKNGIMVTADSIIRNCSANSNSSNGLYVAAGCVVKGNHCAGNGGPGGGAGVLAGGDCRIEDNHLRHNQYGVRITAGSGSLVIRNSAVMNTIKAFDLTPDTHSGMILSNEAMRADFVINNPWVNFEQ